MGDLTGISSESSNGDGIKLCSRKSSGSANETNGIISMSHQAADRRSSGHSRNSMDSDEVVDEDEMYCGEVTPNLCDDDAEDSGESSDDAASELLSLLEHNPASQGYVGNFKNNAISRLSKYIVPTLREGWLGILYQPYLSVKPILVEPYILRKIKISRADIEV